MKIAFDIDCTLIQKDIHGRDVPRYDVIDLLRWFMDHGHYVHIWSGGGVAYARQWAEKLGLPIGVSVISKDEYHGMDISVDDEDVVLAKINIKI